MLHSKFRSAARSQNEDTSWRTSARTEMPNRSEEAPLGQPFAIREFQMALALSSSLPFQGTRVAVVTDNEVVPEAIEVTAPRLRDPGWFVCKSNEGPIL